MPWLRVPAPVGQHGVGYMDRLDYVSMLSNEVAYVECLEHCGPLSMVQHDATWL